MTWFCLFSLKYSDEKRFFAFFKHVISMLKIPFEDQLNDVKMSSDKK